MTDGMFHDCALMIYLEVEASPEPVEGTPLTRPMWPDSKSCNQFFEHKILVLIGKSKPQDILVISITIRRATKLQPFVLSTPSFD